MPAENYENQHINKIINQLKKGQTNAAIMELKELRETADEKFLEKYSWRIHELFGAVFHDLGDMEGAVQAYWNAFSSDTILLSQREHFSSYLFCLHYLDGISDKELAQQHFQYGSLFEDDDCEKIVSTQKREKIRIGYLASDLGRNTTESFAECLLTEYDKNIFEVYCYTLSYREDSTTRHLSSAVDGWKCLANMPVMDAVSLIREDELDILVDLSGHSAGGRTLILMSYRLAPIQLSGIGWFDTTGLKQMDGFLTDEYLDPRGENDELFTEKLLRLKRTHLCRKLDENIPDLCHDTLNGNNRGIVFGSFNNFSKITDNMLGLWKNILEKVPGSRLVLKDTMCHKERMEAMAERLIQAGFEREQIRIAGSNASVEFPNDIPLVELRAASKEYLQEYNDIDICLDTYPYTGGGTSFDAISMGVPVINRYGTRHGSRFGFSLMNNLGHPEWCAESDGEYVEKAVMFAMDRARLDSLHNSLRRELEDSALTDTAEYVEEVQRLYQKLYNDRKTSEENISITDTPADAPQPKTTGEVYKRSVDDMIAEMRAEKNPGPKTGAEEGLLCFVPEGPSALKILTVESSLYIPGIREKLPNAEIYAMTKYEDVSDYYPDEDIHWLIRDFENQTAYPYEKNFFNIIIAEGVLETSQDPYKIFSRLNQLLASDGKLLTCYTNVRYHKVLENLRNGHFYAKGRHLYAKSEVVRLMSESLFKEVSFVPGRRDASEEDIQKAEEWRNFGFEDYSQDLITEIWLVSAGRFKASTAALKSCFTPEIRQQLVNILRRIEYGIDEGENFEALWKLCFEQNIFPEYLADFMAEVIYHKKEILAKIKTAAERHGLEEYADAIENIELSAH